MSYFSSLHLVNVGGFIRISFFASSFHSASSHPYRVALCSPRPLPTRCHVQEFSAPREWATGKRRTALKFQTTGKREIHPITRQPVRKLSAWIHVSDGYHLEFIRPNFGWTQVDDARVMGEVKMGEKPRCRGLALSWVGDTTPLTSPRRC